MNITVINVRDLIKCIIILCILVIILVCGVKVVKGKEDNEIAEQKNDLNNSSLLYCLEMEVPIMAEDDTENKKEKNTLSSSYMILDTGIAMLSNINEKESLTESPKEEIKEEENKEEIEQEQEINRTVDNTQKLETAVIEENNISPSFTNSEADIQVKNQSSYDIAGLIKDTNYQLKNKNKVIIYHTHTCESYTSSEKYSYEMTGTYRTTDLGFTVAKVRR